ncbi:hypothetical protein MMC28_000499 [Mycoblastus sanguinarius]|nr:hypothetical protein [Mycoblastus sanguinarius]
MHSLPLTRLALSVESASKSFLSMEEIFWVEEFKKNCWDQTFQAWTGFHQSSASFQKQVKQSAELGKNITHTKKTVPGHTSMDAQERGRIGMEGDWDKRDPEVVHDSMMAVPEIAENPFDEVT